MGNAQLFMDLTRAEQPPNHAPEGRHGFRSGFEVEFAD
jgi:hypothetical protein